MSVGTADHYVCDNAECGKEKVVFTMGDRVLYGRSPIANWIILKDDECFCSEKCFLAVRKRRKAGRA